MSCVDRTALALAFAVLLALAAAPATAAPTTTTVPATAAEPEPVDIQADFGELDRAAGRGTYKGNVVIVQGTMRITADEVRIFLESDELSRIEIDGKPATFEHKIDAAPQPTRGMARNMVYLVKESTVELKGEARIEQRGDEVAGESIRYDLKNDRVLAASGAGSGERVQMTITPRRKPTTTTPTPPAEKK